MFFELLLQHFNTINLKRFISINLVTKSTTPFDVGLFVLRTDSKGRSKQTVRWTVCPAVAFPQKSESVLTLYSNK